MASQLQLERCQRWLVGPSQLQLLHLHLLPGVHLDNFTSPRVCTWITEPRQVHTWIIVPFQVCTCKIQPLQVCTWMIGPLQVCSWVLLAIFLLGAAPCQVQPFAEAPGALRSHCTFCNHCMSSPYRSLPQLINGNCTKKVIKLVKRDQWSLVRRCFKSQEGQEKLCSSSLSLLREHIWILQIAEM